MMRTALLMAGAGFLIGCLVCWIVEVNAAPVEPGFIIQVVQIKE